MSDRSRIEWTDATWNPLRARLKDDTLIQLADGRHKEVREGVWGYHCERVSPGCKFCYACTMNGRTLPAWGTGLDYTKANRDKVEIYLDEAELRKPMHWRRPRQVFVCSMTDLFADFVSDKLLDRMFLMMAACPQHNFQILTKRAERLPVYAFQFGMNGVLPNGILGVSVESQEWADKRRNYLDRMAARGWRTFVSYEPALGPVNWKGWEFLDWMISGGESGPRARPCHPDWHRTARDWCRKNRVPYLFKQWGQFRPLGSADLGNPDFDEEACRNADEQATVRVWPDGRVDDGNDESAQLGAWMMEPVGKKKAGRLLDGQTWDEMLSRVIH